MKTNSTLPDVKNENRCLSCGTFENLGKRRYCSKDCRQRLRYSLEIRTGLLKALNTRYGTFYFTDFVIIMDILPFSSKEIFSYIYPRSPGKKPAEGFSGMAEILGETWWAERRRTNKKYLASRRVLEEAKRNNNFADSIRPLEITTPSIKGASLIHLKLGKSELNSPELQSVIKNAYRRQAKKHHPDLGGDNAAFRKIHRAYEELINWAENPIFRKRRGFPDKWFYDGNNNGWVQPTPRQEKIVK